MASETSLCQYDTKRFKYLFPVNEATESIGKTGAYILEDASAGNQVRDFASKGFPFKTPYGLQFCLQNSFLSENIRDLIENSLVRPYFGLFKTYNANVLSSKTAYFFFADPKREVRLILLWSPDSEIILFEGSHNMDIKGKEMSGFGLATLPHEEMEREGIKARTVAMKQGGITIVHGGVGWTMLAGEQISIGFASEKEILGLESEKQWTKMEIGDTDAMRKKVAELNEERIRTNFVYVAKPTDTTPTV